MKTLTIEVKDDFMVEFLKIIDSVKDNVKIKRDKNIELDPFFYEKQKELHKIRDDIKSGNATMITEKEYEIKMKQFFTNLETKYAN